MFPSSFGSRAGILRPLFNYTGASLERERAHLTIVGLISDTHGRLPERALWALADSDHIIHAGDIGDPDILLELEELAPTTAVLGNNDYREYGDEVGRFARPVIDGVRFLVAHYPSDVCIGYNGCPGLAPGDPIPQVCIHGHTHVPEIVTGSDALPARFIVCAGSPSRPRGGFPPTVGHIEIEDGRVERVRVETFGGGVVLEAVAEDAGSRGARP